MVDANVLIDAEKAGRGRVELEQIVRAVLTAGGKVLVPAPVIAELNRRAPFDPRAAGFEPVAFGLRASMAIGSQLFSTVKKDRVGDGVRMKWDLMVVGCAMVSNVDVLLAQDAGLRSAAAKAGVVATDRAAFILEYVEGRQLNLAPRDD